MHTKKIVRFIVVFMVAILFISSKSITIASANNENNSIVINNSGFENNMTYWGVWNASGNLKIDSESNFRYSGSKSILMNNTLNKSARGTIAQVISNIEGAVGKSITLTQWLKSEGLKGEGIQLRVNFLDSNGKVIEKMKVYDLQMEENKPWTKRDLKFYVPNNENIRKIEIGYLYDNNVGKLWIDEISGKITEVQQDGDIIKNSSFEDGITEWGTWNSTGNLGVSIEKNLRYDGENSLFIYNKRNNKARGTVAQIFGNIESSIGKSISVTQWIKSENFYGEGLQLRVRFLNDNEEQIGKLKVYDLDIEATKPWTKRDIKFYVPDNNLIHKIEIAYLYDNASGNIWIDNIDGKIEEASEEKGIIKNPSFEDGITEWGLWNANGNLAAYIENNLRYDGQKSLLLKNKKSEVGRGTIAQIIEDTSNMINKNLVLSQWIKSENFISDGLKLRVRFLDSSENIIGNMKEYNINVSSNSNWIKSETNIIVPNNPDIEKIEIAYLYDNGTGNLWFDRVSAEIKNRTDIDVENKQINNESIILGNQGSSVLGNLLIDDYISKITNISEIQSGKIEFDNKLNYTYTPNSNFHGYDKVTLEYLDINEVPKKIEISTYVAPSIEVIKNSVLKNNSRILITNEKFEEIKNNIEKDENMKKWYSSIEKKADEVLNSSVIQYSIEDGLRLNVDSSDVIILMSFMYRITDNVKYADRAWAEIDNIINYKDWNNNHLLDTSTLAYGMGVGYDWLNSYLTDVQKGLIKTALKDKALNYAKELYEINSPVFVSETLNWNIVCNSGFIISALSIFDNDDYSAEIIQEGFKSINNFLLTYYDGGDTLEGPGYWEYSTKYLVYLLESINMSMNIENYFVDAPGVNKTMEFLLAMTGNLGIYNYSDSYSNFVGGDLSLWFAKQYNNSKFAKVSKIYKEKTNDFSIYDLIWYDANIYNSEDNIELDYVFDKTNVGSFRSSWNLNESNYLAFKGGENGIIHGDLDLGSFIYDSLGIRWAIDLGRDDYNIDGYWDYESGRWNLYKKSAEGHNTIIIGNDIPTKQKINARAEIASYEINTTNPYAIVDLKNAYGDSVLNLTRKFELINNRIDAKITDSFEFLNEEDITWQMHTLAEVLIKEDGKLALLQYGNKVLKIELEDNINAKFEIIKLEDIKVNDEEVNKLVIKGKAKSGYISVTMSSEFSSNIIKNSSFESNLNYWGVIGADKLDISLDNNIFESGEKSLKLTNKDIKNKGGISQIIDENIENIIGKVINVSQSIKSNNLLGNTFELRAKFFDRNGKEIEQTKLYELNIPLNNEWIKDDNKIYVPNNSDINFIELQYIYNESYGDVWIDSIEAKIIENTESIGLIKNSNFEDGINYWGIWNQTNNLKVKIDNNNKYSGEKSVKIGDLNEVARGSISQKIQLSKEDIGGILNISQYLKSNNINGNGLILRATFFDENNNQIDLSKNYSIMDVGSNWAKTENSINIPNNNLISSVEVQYIYDSNKGELWIDNIETSVEENILESSILSNNSFEDALNYWGIWNANSNLLAGVDRDIFYSGKSSVKLSNNNDIGRGTISQVILNSEQYVNKVIEVSQYIRSKSVVGNGLKLRVNFMNTNGVQVESMKHYDININNQDKWTEEKVYIQVPNNSNISKIEIQYLYDSNMGEIWIDKITTNINEKIEKLGLLDNSRFEDGINSWGVWNATGNLGVSIDQNIYYSGKQSVNMFNVGSSVARGTIGNLIENINIESDKNINIKYKIKSENLSGSGVQIRIKFYFEDGTEDMHYETINILPIQDWIEKEVNISRSKNIKNLEVQYLYDNSTGNVWIDDIELTVK